MKTKYRISYKNPDGSHHSSETLSADELIIKLLSTYPNNKENLMPTRHFEVEKRTHIGSSHDE